MLFTFQAIALPQLPTKLRWFWIMLLCGLGMPDRDAWAQTCTKPILSENKVLGCILEPMPEYKDGGQAGLKRFITQNLHYPPGQQKSGRAFIGFIVTKQGYTRNFAILKGMGEPFDTEALRVTKRMGKWIPVKYDVRYTLPITFSNNSQTITKSKEQ